MDVNHIEPYSLMNSWVPPMDPTQFRGYFKWSQVEDISGRRPEHVVSTNMEGRIHLQMPSIVDDTLVLHGEASQFNHVARKAYLNNHENGMQFYVQCSNKHPCFAGTMLWRLCLTKHQLEAALDNTTMRLVGECPTVATKEAHGVATLDVKKTREGIEVEKVVITIPLSKCYRAYAELLNQPMK